MARRYAIKEVTSVNDVVHHIRDGLDAAAANPITSEVEIAGEKNLGIASGSRTDVFG
jgi:hypothetical protein